MEGIPKRAQKNKEFILKTSMNFNHLFFTRFIIPQMKPKIKNFNHSMLGFLTSLNIAVSDFLCYNETIR